MPSLKKSANSIQIKLSEIAQRKQSPQPQNDKMPPSSELRLKIESLKI